MNTYDLLDSCSGADQKGSRFYQAHFVTSEAIPESSDIFLSHIPDFIICEVKVHLCFGLISYPTLNAAHPELARHAKA